MLHQSAYCETCWALRSEPTVIKLYSGSGARQRDSLEVRGCFAKCDMGVKALRRPAPIYEEPRIAEAKTSAVTDSTPRPEFTQSTFARNKYAHLVELPEKTKALAERLAPTAAKSRHCRVPCRFSACRTERSLKPFKV